MVTLFKNIYRIVLLLILFTSCSASYKIISIETAQPSSEMLPENIKSLTLLNRSVTDDFRNYNADSLQSYFYSKKFDVEAILLDSLAADTTLKALGQLLFESGRYDVVIPEDRFISHNTDFYKIPDQLSWPQVKEICSDFNTDALLVIERYYNRLTTGYNASATFLGYETYATANIDSRYDAAVRIYDPVKEEIIRQFVIDDTIYWYETDPSTTTLFIKLPSIKKCLIESGIQVALDIDSKLSPQWVKDSRTYYILDKKNPSIAVNYINSDNWQAAYDHWSQYLNSENKTVKSKAEYNVALASEMLGNIDNAIEWANKSYYTLYRVQTENYLYILKKRKEAIQKFESTDIP